MEKQFSILHQKLNSVLIRVEKLEQKQGEYEKTLNFYGEQITDLQKQLKAIREVGTVKENEEGEMRKTVIASSDELSYKHTKEVELRY